MTAAAFLVRAPKRPCSGRGKLAAAFSEEPGVPPPTDPGRPSARGGDRSKEADVFEKCANCNLRIVAGANMFHHWAFCSATCRTKFQCALIDNLVPAEDVDKQVRQAFEGPCPSCGRIERNDVYSATRVTGMLIVYTTKIQRELCCPRCAKKNLLRAALYCLAAGWWSPRAAFANLFILPGNLISCLLIRPAKEPSQRLIRRVKVSMAESMLPRLLASMQEVEDR